MQKEKKNTDNRFDKIVDELFKKYHYGKGELKMRDPQRIDKILNMIATLWRRNQDQRLGQLLYNYAGFKDTDYNTEDDKIEEKLREAISNIKRGE